MLLFIRICINNDVPAQELRNLRFVVAEASVAGPCVLKCDVSGVCGGKPAGVRESEKCRRWSFLGRGGGVGGASSSGSVSLVSDTQIFGKRQQSAHLSKVH